MLRIFPDCEMPSRFGHFGFQTESRPISEMMARQNLEREIKLVARIMFMWGRYEDNAEATQSDRDR